ncbi:MAG TPA: hypothetical protein PK572_11580 [Kiritimatiellia bacterium]|nr:hypothetical protein [Kiritimatiellia bacterium]
MTRNAKKRAAPSGKSATSNANSPKHKPCACSGQLHFHGFPPPPDPFRGPLVDWLEANPGWWGRAYLCAAVNMDERTLRLQAEHSGGRVVFSSGSGGLCATIHAGDFMVKNCAAELRGRGASHFRRAAEVEAAWARIGAAQ